MSKSGDSLKNRRINDGLYLYKRSNSKKWQARIRRASNEWFAMSCSTEIFEEAQQQALERQSQMLEAQKNGIVDISKRFSDVARLTARELQDEIDADMAQAVNRDYIQVINRYLIPALGKYQITQIDHRTLIKLDDFRIQTIGRKPSKSTINTHNAALNRVFRTAISRGFLLPFQIPTLVNRGRKVKARPYFDTDDYKLVSRNLREFAKTGHKHSTRMLREMLRDYALILANTGMRPGKEAYSLKWNQISRSVTFDRESTKREKFEILKFSVTGKGRSRTLICRDDQQSVTKPLQRLQDRFAELKGLSEQELFKVDEWVFRTTDGKRPTHERLTKAFRLFLDQYNLLTNKEGGERSLYSLRHTYATTQLREGTDWNQLATNMGTSVKMLHDHYSNWRPEDNAKQFSGFAIRQRRQAASEINEIEKREKTIEQLNETISRLTRTIDKLSKS